MDTIIVLDFGSQYTQLIARKVRELNIYCEIHPFNKIPTLTDDVKGVIFSGSPYSCNAADAPVPDMTGMEVARHIREMDKRVIIIFITMLTQYAIEGYSVGAFDYVLKPVRYEEFSTKMDRACRMLAHQNTSLTVELRTKEEIRRISADEIAYIEVANHDILVHTDKEIIRQWGNLKSYEDKLASAHFVRCNACYLVNLKYVRGMTGDMVTVGNDELVISKAKRKDFLIALAQYKGGSR